MARLFIDGFESGDAYLWENPTGGTIVSSSGVDAHSGTYALRLDTSIIKWIPESTVVCIGFTLYIPPTGTFRLYFYTTALDLQGALACSGSWTDTTVYNDADTDDDTHYFGASNNNYHMQVRFENLNTTEKRIQVEVNGVEIIDYTLTNDTPDQTTTNKIGFGGTGGASAPTIDNVIIDDSDLDMYDHEIYAINPNNDGSTNDWETMSGESHYEMVDEHYGGSTFGYALEWIQSETPSAIDLFEMENLDYSDYEIKAVQVSVYGNNGNASGETFKCAVYTSGEAHYGVSGEWLTSFQYTDHIWDNNPATSGEWTQDDIQNLQCGVVMVGI